MVNAIFPGMEV